MLKKIKITIPKTIPKTKEKVAFVRGTQGRAQKVAPCKSKHGQTRKN